VIRGGLRRLLDELKALGDSITGDALTGLLARHELPMEEMATFVTPSPDTYSRRRVARTDHFEVLVMTWLPGQGSGAHDHAGAISAFKILSGTVRETRFAPARDGLVDFLDTYELHEGEVGLDAGGTIHAVRNDAANETPLVSIHIYAPPLPELRRFTERPGDRAITRAFQRPRVPDAPVVAIIGGGFSGAMVASQLMCKLALTVQPVHVVIVDRQASMAEGAAYRTPHACHVLNVPAANMSAWPDRPNDLLDWTRSQNLPAEAYSFLRRLDYGEYLRAALFSSVARANAQTSIEIRRAEASFVERIGDAGWRIRCSEGGPIEADVLVLATGHGTPADPLRQGWSGSRARYIGDPWASLALTAIEAHESVCLLGTGLTSIDVLQSLARPDRTAPVTALSRRGLLPAAHAPTSLPPLDPRAWLEPLLASGNPSMRRIARAIRREIQAAQAAGRDWRQIMDGLRPHISRIWSALPARARMSFLRHGRAFWDVARHRMAPSVAQSVAGLTHAGLFRTAAARLVKASGDMDGVTLTVRRRGEPATEILRFDWVVNCTGTVVGQGVGFSPVVAGLIEAGCLEADDLGLGVRSTAEGQALAVGRVIDDLIIVGAMRRGDLWESTAVPDLRKLAAQAADTVVRKISALGRQNGVG